MKVREHRQGLVSRVPRLQALFVALLVAIGSTYWFVQVVQGDYFRDLAENNRLRRISVKAPRGLIYDRQGRLLVKNVPSYNLKLEVERARTGAEALNFASQVLDAEVSALAVTAEKARREKQRGPILLAENLSLPEVASFAAAALEHPEFEIDVQQLRLNLHGPFTAHVLGYLREVSEDDLAASKGALGAGSMVGRKGIEQTFDELLRGRDGEREIIVDSRGRLRQESGRKAATPGESLVLSLDLDLQQEAARFFSGKVGAAVALRPESGEILALVSSPSYDPNLFARRLDSDQWRALLEADNDPLQNRAIQNQYSPGSIFKLVMAVAGLSEGAVNERDTVFCGGSTRIYDRRFRCWKRSGHGRVDLRRAIKESCDIYFYYLGQKLGISRIAHFARLMGLGTKTGIDLAGEKSGLVPDGEWKLRARGEPWYPGETISVAIGQGPLLVTPLQIATLMATISNGGLRVSPHLAKSSAGLPEKLAVKPEALERVREAMWATVNESGTGARARVPGIDVFGKTGTVQVVEQKTWIESEELPFEKRDHAWFASFAESDERRLAVAIFVEHGGKGSASAAPLAKRLYEIYFRHRPDRNTL